MKDGSRLASQHPSLPNSQLLLLHPIERLLLERKKLKLESRRRSTLVRNDDRDF